MKRELLWLWLNNLPGIGLKKTAAMLNYFGDIEEIWLSTKEQLKTIQLLTEKDCEQVINTRNMDRIKSYEAKLLYDGITYCTIESTSYPQSIKHIYDPPYVLYIKGTLPSCIMSVAVVGARKCTEYGRAVAFNISKALAKEDVAIISGMARGIDTAAHKGALASGGKTVAVLGCGLDICYPKENALLMKEIEEKGAIISEYPVGTAPRAGNFPMRNRIISGISDRLVVVEAAKRSGSLITADQALEQGKDVYAVPGSIFSTYSMGTNDLLKQGARMLTSAEDILMDLDIKNRSISMNNEKNLRIKLAKDEKMIYDSLGLEPLHMDMICSKVGIPTNKVQHILTIMELNGYIQQLPGKRFIKNVTKGER